jgi:hypothetical protein
MSLSFENLAYVDCFKIEKVKTLFSWKPEEINLSDKTSGFIPE